MSRPRQFDRVTPLHQQQLHELRQWARKQGGTPSGESNKARQDLAQERTEGLAPQASAPSPAPDVSPTENA